MDWNDLKYFLAVYRARSISGAARALGVDHSTVGRRLAALEDALGVRLFDRTPTGVAPTEAAEEIAAGAERTEASVRDIEDAASGADTRIEGVVRVTTSESFSGYLIRRLVPLRARHPALQVDVLSGNRTFDLAYREADLALRFTPTEQPDLLTRTVARAGWGVYAASGYLEDRPPPSLDDGFAGHDVVGYGSDLSGVPGARWLDENATAAQVVLRGNSIVAVCHAVIAGMGISSLPCVLADPEPILERVVPEPVDLRPLYLVAHPAVARIARVRAVIDFLVAALDEDEVLLRGS